MKYICKREDNKPRNTEEPEACLKQGQRAGFWVTGAGQGMRGGEAKGGAGQAASGRAPVTKGAPSPKLEAKPCSVPLALLLPHSGKKLDMLIKKKKKCFLGLRR